MASVGNSHRSASPRPTPLEEGQELFVDSSSILYLCITGINPEAVKWGDDHYDRPLCPSLQPGPPSQTPGGLGQKRYWSVSEVTWPPNLELRRWRSSGPSSLMIWDSRHDDLQLFWLSFKHWASRFCNWWLKIDWDCLVPNCIMGSCDQCGFPLVFRPQWQSLCR